MSDKRSQIMKHFGPKLLEAVTILTLNEINELRTSLGLPPRTLDQVFDQITNHYSNLPDYNWPTLEGE